MQSDQKSTELASMTSREASYNADSDLRERKAMWVCDSFGRQPCVREQTAGARFCEFELQHQHSLAL